MKVSSASKRYRSLLEEVLKTEQNISSTLLKPLLEDALNFFVQERTHSALMAADEKPLAAECALGIWVCLGETPKRAHQKSQLGHDGTDKVERQHRRGCLA